MSENNFYFNQPTKIRFKQLISKNGYVDGYKPMGLLLVKRDSNAAHQLFGQAIHYIRDLPLNVTFTQCR